MKRLVSITLLCIVMASSQLYAQTLKTFILIRHAEKAQDGTNDPGLTEEGVERSLRLASLLETEEIEAIYSTDYKRTTETVRPLAEANEMEIQTYKPFDKGFLGLLADNTSGTVIISGHSNTIPNMVNELIGEDRYEQLNEDQYNFIFVVTISEVGNGKVVRLNY